MSPTISTHNSVTTTLRLDCNESFYGPPPAATEAAVRELHGRSAQYPDTGSALLRERLAEIHGVTPDMVVVGNGADDLILKIAMTFVRPGDKFVVNETTFPGYVASGELVGGTAIRVPLDGYGLSAPALCDSITSGVRVVYVCNPNNPTGSVLSANEITSITTAALKHQAIPVIDEAYIEFAEDSTKSAVHEVRAGRQVLVLRTLSKAWGLAGLRVGYLIGPADLVGQISRTHQVTPYAVNRIAQAAAAAALSDCGHIGEVRRRTTAARARLYSGLTRLGVWFAPSVTNFVLIRVPIGQADLAAHGVQVRDTARFGLPGYLRVTVGSPDQVDEFCARLRTVLASVAPAAVERGPGPLAAVVERGPEPLAVSTPRR